MTEVYHMLRDWLREGKTTALATLISRKGSAMRPVGARMAISAAGEMQGSISGGCVEGALVQEAQACLMAGQPRRLRFGISDDSAWSVGLMCGGEIEVLVEPVNLEVDSRFPLTLIDELLVLRRARQPHAHFSVLEGAQVGLNGVLLPRDGSWEGNPPAGAGEGFYRELNEMLRMERSAILTVEAGEVFIEIFKPSPRVVIIGAVHLTEALVRLANVMGYQCVIIEPRKAFAHPEKFPEAEALLQKWPQEALEEIGINAEDYLLALSHDDKFDLPAIAAGLDKGVGYIGMLASRQTRARRSALLAEEGYAKEALARIHAPIGLDIGAQNPQEIALAIITEITAYRYGKLGAEDKTGKKPSGSFASL